MTHRILKILGITLASVLVVLVTAAVLFSVFGNVWLRGPLERMASRQLEREVSIGTLQMHLLSLTPGITLENVRIGDPYVAGSTDRPLDMAVASRFDAAIRLWPLLGGRIVLTRLGLEDADIRLIRSADGQANWAFGGAEDSASTTPLTLPVIEYLYVKNSRLRLDDAVSGLAFDGQFTTEEQASGEGEPFTLQGRGNLNKQPFKLMLSGGALTKALQDGGRTAYPFDLDVTHGATRITAKGHFNSLMDFGGFTAAMTLDGRNLADLYYLTGLALPITRAYSLKGELMREGDEYRLNTLMGKLGSSDISGNLKVNVSGDKPVLTADLASDLLDPADAGVVFGAEEALEGDAKYLIPDMPLEVTRLRSMDADVRYAATAINVDTLPLKQVSLTLHLKDGRLELNPLALTLPQGIVSGSVVIDASPTVPFVAVDMRLRGTLDDFAAQAGQKGAISGPLLARVKVEGRGHSFHDALGVANGTAAVVVPNGEIRKAFAELTGVNARGLGLLLTGSQTQTPIRCGVASFDAKDGLLTARHLVVDTGVVRLDGAGTVNFKDERLALTLHGTPKETRLVRLLVPLRINGTLMDPEVGASALPLGVQAGTAAALGVALTPLAAILPFVDIGLAENANCGALMADVRQQTGVTTQPSRR